MASKQSQIRLNDSELALIDRLAETMRTSPAQRIRFADVIRIALDDSAEKRLKAAPKKNRKPVPNHG